MINTRLFRCLGAALLLAGLVAPVRPAAAQTAAPGWRDTGIDLAAVDGRMCIDGSRPSTVVVNQAGGAVAFDWTTGARTSLSELRFDRCGADGALYAAGEGGRGWRFSLDNPAPRALDHAVTHTAEDGSAWVYSLTPSGTGPARLWASPDGGQTWQERGRQFAGTLEQLVVAPADGRSLYLLTIDRSRRTPSGMHTYAIQYSPDGGATWQEHSRTESASAGAGFPSFGMQAPAGAPPVTALELWVRNGSGSGSPAQHLLSTDGGRTFRQLPSGLDVGTQVAFSAEGSVFLSSTGQSFGLSLQTPDGASQPLPRPPAPAPGPGRPPELLGSRAAPANLFLNGAGAGLWHSPDGGRSWQQLAAEERTQIMSPYAPLAVLGVQNGRLFALELPGSASRLAAPTFATGAPGSLFYPITGHSISPLFLPLWTRNGGLAQFGYPRTPAFREVNPADGRIYTVQYFERNRFEYHPENRGTPYEVLLGLLGNQQTEARRAAGEAPFQRTTPPSQPDVRFFPETGHTLGGVFLAYWQRNGGLAIYGYPISEPFEEVNPEDGRTYVVQYFERNRFEYHPENRGTPYEVLLGLLGNTLLRSKGWL
ncbi:MAG TPA: sialidase family protein [Roseiflexaceae bacterium]|nr:sialidase family protein [Roseiflexaceae bacterium]